MGDKKYYWLKLKKDFFKRHDVRIIESMPNGKDYVLFYLKMLVESIDHEGHLRFNDTIPYNVEMLSTITNTNIDIVRAAMKVFTELNMIEVLEDKTIYMAEVEKMIGSETYWAEQKRKQREIGHIKDNVHLLSNVSNQEIEIDIEKEIEKDISDTPYENHAQVWDYYADKLKEINKTRKRTEKKMKHIRARLNDGFTVEQLKQVIDSVFSNDFMLGKNERNKAYIDIENFMCNTEKVEKWLDSAPIQQPTFDRSRYIE